jgi:hypothetical protein
MVHVDDLPAMKGTTVVHQDIDVSASLKQLLNRKQFAADAVVAPDAVNVNSVKPPAFAKACLMHGHLIA